MREAAMKLSRMTKICPHQSWAYLYVCMFFVAIAISFLLEVNLRMSPKKEIVSCVIYFTDGMQHLVELYMQYLHTYIHANSIDFFGTMCLSRCPEVYTGLGSWNVTTLKFKSMHMFQIITKNHINYRKITFSN